MRSQREAPVSTRPEKLNLYGIPPEEIARRVMETPPPFEAEKAKERARKKRAEAKNGARLEGGCDD